MGIFKYICNKLSCKSNCITSCNYNNQEFDCKHLKRSLDNYKLKNQDIEIILKILTNREILKNKNMLIC